MSDVFKRYPAQQTLARRSLHPGVRRRHGQTESNDSPSQDGEWPIRDSSHGPVVSGIDESIGWISENERRPEGNRWTGSGAAKSIRTVTGHEATGRPGPEDDSAHGGVEGGWEMGKQMSERKPDMFEFKVFEPIPETPVVGLIQRSDHVSPDPLRIDISDNRSLAVRSSLDCHEIRISFPAHWHHNSTYEGENRYGTVIVLRRTRDHPAEYRFGLLLRTTSQGTRPDTKAPDTEKTFIHPCATFADIVVSLNEAYRVIRQT